MVGCKGGGSKSIGGLSPVRDDVSPVFRALRWIALAAPRPRALRPPLADDPAAFDLEATRARADGDRDHAEAPEPRRRRTAAAPGRRDPLGVALQAAIADLTPRLAASAKRLAELTPKTKDKDAEPATDAATAELENEKQKHDALDANLRAARAMLLEVDDLTHPDRRARGANSSPARPSPAAPRCSIRACGSASRARLPVDATARPRAPSTTGLAACAAASTPAKAIGLAARRPRARACSRSRSAGSPRRVIFRDPDAEIAEPAAARARRGLDLAGPRGPAAARPLGARDRARRLRPLRSAHAGRRRTRSLDAVRLLRSLLNAVGRGMLAPTAAAWRLVPVGDRVGAHRCSAATWRSRRSGRSSGWSSPRPTPSARSTSPSPAAALGATLVALALASTLRRLAPGAPPGRPPCGRAGRPLGARRARSAGSSRWSSSRAAAAGYIAFATFLVNQAIFLDDPRLPALSSIDIVVQRRDRGRCSSRSAASARGSGHVRPAPQHARRRSSVVLQGVARVRAGLHRRRGGARSPGACSRRTVRLAARGLFRLRGRRRHAVAVVDDRRRRWCSPSSCSSPG